MRSPSSNIIAGNFPIVLAALVLTCNWAAPAAAQPAQRGFATAEEAAKALIEAAERFDVPVLLEILGPDGKDLVVSADPVEDKNNATAFAKRALAKHQVVVDPKNKARATLMVGPEDWPGPIPIVKRKGMWYFDSKAGSEEVLFRRIGENELDAIQICRGFVEAQHAYALEARAHTGVNQYAQRIISTPGKRDGLAWQNPDGSWGGQVGEFVAKALEQGYTDRAEPFHGYYFKVLKGQGPSVPMGELDFVVGGVMIGGFALVAAPAQYRVTGVQTFIVSHDGIVYQKDLGPDTLTVFKNMERYDPDKSWRRTEDAWPN